MSCGRVVYRAEKQTPQWSKEKVQKDKQRSTKHKNITLRSNKANLLIALVQLPVFQMKMTFQEIRIIATGPNSESIARCKHHMEEKLVYCCTYLENL